MSPEPQDHDTTALALVKKLLSINVLKFGHPRTAHTDIFASLEEQQRGELLNIAKQSICNLFPLPESRLKNHSLTKLHYHLFNDI